jgi:hypothetical protein
MVLLREEVGTLAPKHHLRQVIYGTRLTRVVKTLMQPHTRRISGGLQAVHGTAWSLDARDLRWMQETGGHCLALDDGARDEHECHTP